MLRGSLHHEGRQKLDNEPEITEPEIVEPETAGVEELPTETWNGMARSPEPRAVALKGKHERGKREPARMSTEPVSWRCLTPKDGRRW